MSEFDITEFARNSITKISTINPCNLKQFFESRRVQLKIAEFQTLSALNYLTLSFKLKLFTFERYELKIHYSLSSLQFY